MSPLDRLTPLKASAFLRAPRGCNRTLADLVFSETGDFLRDRNVGLEVVFVKSNEDGHCISTAIISASKGAFSRKLRPGIVSAAVSSKLPHRLASLDSIAPFPARGRGRPCRNSHSRPTMYGRVNKSSRESRNNFRRPPRFGRSLEARSRRRL